MSKMIALILPAMFLLTGAACSPQRPSVQPAQPVNTIYTPTSSQQPSQPVQPINNVPANPPAIDQKTFNISGTEYKFTPSTIKVSTNERVKLVFKNDGELPHNLSVRLPGGVTTKTIMPGETDAVTFVTPAEAQTVSFWCTVNSHGALGMQGSIVISE